MKIVLVDKNYRYSPLNLENSVMAKFEIECKDDEELMAILSHMGSLDVNNLLPKKAVPVAITNSGVQPTKGLWDGIAPANFDHPLHSEKPKPVQTPEISENKVEESPMGPISSLEID